MKPSLQREESPGPVKNPKWWIILRSFLQRKGVSLSIREYLITALSYMALGLFSTLIIGLIIKTVGEQVLMSWSPTMANAFIEVGVFASDPKIMGGAIGVAIAYGLKAPPLVIFSSLFAGAFGAELGGPAGSYFTALVACELGKIIYQTTRVDIIVTPFTTIFAGFLVGMFIGPGIDSFMVWIGALINWSTMQQPIIMGVLVAVFMGLALTAPISSAAIGIMLGLDGLAAGAATVGCSAQMIGFAVLSYRDNGIGGSVAVGIGTPMLQIANILKKPILIIPPTVAGALLAPVATVILKLGNNAAGSGMGTSGLAGQLMTFEYAGLSLGTLYKILLLHFIGPAVICFIMLIWFRKKGWVKTGDLKISYE